MTETPIQIPASATEALSAQHLAAEPQRGLTLGETPTRQVPIGAFLMEGLRAAVVYFESANYAGYYVSCAGQIIAGERTRNSSRHARRAAKLAARKTLKQLRGI